MNTDRKVCITLLVLFASCTNRQLVDPGFFDPEAKRSANGILDLHATYTAPYCGGADPGPEGMPRPEPWQGHMYLRRAVPDSTGRFAINDIHTRIDDSLRTDATGKASVVLAVGTYLLLDRDRMDDRRYQQLLKDYERPTLHTDAIDKDCLDRWLHGPFGLVTITSGDTTRVELPLFDQCPWYNTPCVNYHGPLPP